MKILLPFIIEHWAAVSAVIAAIGLRLFPTEKNYDIFSKILRILDLIVPNMKKGGGRHVAKAILFFVLVFVSENSFAQLNTRTRQIRFATGVQAAADTAETASNAGRVWYDFETGRYRANFDGINDFFGEGGGGAYWPLGGNASLTSNVEISTGANTLYFTSATFSDWSTIMAFDGSFSVTTTSPTEPGTTLINFVPTGFDLVTGGQTGINANMTTNDVQLIAADDVIFSPTDDVLIQPTDDVAITSDQFSINTTGVLYSSVLGLRVRGVSTNQIFLAQNSSGGSVIDATDGLIRFSGSGAEYIDITAGADQKISAGNSSASVDVFTIAGADGVSGRTIGDDIVLTGGDASIGSGSAGGDITIAVGDGDGAGVDGTLFLTGNIDLTPVSSSSEIYSGIYTPTGTVSTNTTAVTPSQAQYMRIGDVVTVSGVLSWQTTAAGLARVYLSVPINAAGTVTSDDASGTGMGVDGTLGSIAVQGGTSNRVLLSVSAAGAGTWANVRYTYTYYLN